MKYIISIFGIFRISQITLTSIIGTIFFTILTFAVIQTAKHFLKEKMPEKFNDLVYFGCPFLIWWIVGWILSKSFLEGFGIGVQFSILGNYFYKLAMLVWEKIKK